MEENKLKKIVLSLVAIILVIFIINYLNLVSFVVRILTVLAPLFIGFIYAWLFNPLINKFSKKYNRGLVSVILFFIFIILVGLLLYLLIPIFYKEVAEVADLLPVLFENIENKVNNMGFKDYLDKILVFLVDNVPIYLIDFIKGLFKYIGVIGVGLILGLYISIEYDKIVANIQMIVPKKIKCFFINLTQDVSEEVRKCVNGTLFVAFLVFLLDSLGFFIIKLDAPILFGALCGITDLIPYIGPYIGGIVAVVVGFTESRVLGIITIVICVVVQCIENYILQPIVMSKSIKISPVLIILGLLVFGNLFGVVGMIMATPFVAIIKVIIEHIAIVLKKCKE